MDVMHPSSGQGSLMSLTWLLLGEALLGYQLAAGWLS